MRFRHRQSSSQLPTLDVTPMLTVMMGILGFFVLVTLMMSGQQGLDVQLPSATDTAAAATGNSPQLIVLLDAQGQIRVNGQVISRGNLEGQIRGYLSSNPQGFVVLQADPQVSYQQVVSLLEAMKSYGGDRISLAIEGN